MRACFRLRLMSRRCIWMLHTAPTRRCRFVHFGIAENPNNHQGKPGGFLLKPPWLGSRGNLNLPHGKRGGCPSSNVRANRCYDPIKAGSLAQRPTSNAQRSKRSMFSPIPLLYLYPLLHLLLSRFIACLAGNSYPWKTLSAISVIRGGFSSYSRTFD